MIIPEHIGNDTDPQHKFKARSAGLTKRIQIQAPKISPITVKVTVQYPPLIKI